MRLSALRIRNFECIDAKGVEIRMDNIIVLIGPNNAGKSAILDAYAAFATAGSEMPLSRFHNENASVPVEIEAVFTDVTEGDQGKIGGTKWLHADPDVGSCVRVLWTWDAPGEKGKKSSWDDGTKSWQSGGMGGFDSLLQSCIPAPIRISPRDDPASTELKIAEILTEVVKTQLKEDASKAAQILEELEKLTKSFGESVKEDVSKACLLIESKLAAIFPGHAIEFVPATGKFEPEKAIGTGSHVRVRRGDSKSIPIGQQGTGFQRAFLWSALAALGDLGRLKHGKATVTADRPKMLLVDEPESFLHPPSVRAAREALYGVSAAAGWQVMATTHSAVFIDVAKPHTTIVRINRDGTSSPKTFSTDRAGFGAEERDRLRMIRSCHPTVNEFFFADQVYLVEGETEHVVLAALLEKSDAEWASKRHVVNCMGKANIPLFARILNQFGVAYTILHDADAPRVRRGETWQKNGMWTINARIADAVGSRSAGLPTCSTVVHVPDFEGFYFGAKLDKDKPYYALQQLQRSDEDAAPMLERIELLKKMLAGESHPGAYERHEDLVAHVTQWRDKVMPTPAEEWHLAEDE